MKYDDVKTFVQTGLAAKGYGTTPGKPMPAFDPGPFTVQALTKKYPNAVVFLVVGNGIGFTKEGLFDRTFVVARCLGLQGNYGYAEALAKDVDDLFDVPGNAVLGAQRVLSVTRNAPPQLVDFDAAQRYAFQTTYIVEAQR